jgi:hypothetical protein
MWVIYTKFSSQLSDEKFNVNFRTVRVTTFTEVTDVYCENISKQLNILRPQCTEFQVVNVIVRWKYGVEL